VFAAARALYRLHDPAGKSMLIAVVEKEQKAESNPLRIRLRNLIRRMKSAAFCGIIPGSGAGSRFYPRAGHGRRNFGDERFTQR